MGSDGNTERIARAKSQETVLGPPSISVIIPAFNEECYIGETIDHLASAAAFLKAHADVSIEIVVVDNVSVDRKASMARNRGATVISVPEHNIARVRNTGARAAAHDVLVFIDADTLVPRELLLRIVQAMIDRRCVGGAVDAVHRAQRPLTQAYLNVWRILGIVGRMAQGACQFCTREVFTELGGYDESLYVGEDVDFYRRLGAVARRCTLETCFIRDLQVVPSARRFDAWPLLRTLFWTNPILMFAFRRRRAAWAGWYERAPR